MGIGGKEDKVRVEVWMWRRGRRVDDMVGIMCISEGGGDGVKVKVKGMVFTSGTSLQVAACCIR